MFQLNYLFYEVRHVVANSLLAQGKTQGSAPRAHQQALTTGPFGNTSEVDAVSPEVAIGGCKTQVSTTRGNASGIKVIMHGDQIILSQA